jgi:GNAT superfamily N-acetyltransferase
MSDLIELRSATPADVPAITHVWYIGWRDGHLRRVPPALLAHRTPRSFESRAAARVATTTVATSASADGLSTTLAGFVTVIDDEVEQLYVDRDWRGTGVAARLLAHAEQRIQPRFDTAWLAVVEGNHRARRFYERQGWDDTGPFDNPAETEKGTMLVPCRRYEKRLATAEAASR